MENGVFERERERKREKEKERERKRKKEKEKPSHYNKKESQKLKKGHVPE